MIRLPARPLSALAGLVLLAVPAGPAVAQSDLDLRDENQRLRTQVSDLEAELNAARSRITELEALVEQLRRQLASRPATPTTTQRTPERVTIDETVPSASPRALFAALQRSYQQTLQDFELGDPESRQRTTYYRALDSWARAMRRELRSPFSWHIRILPDNEQPADRHGIRMQAVDPVTHVKLGNPFIVRLPANVMRKLGQIEQRQRIDVLVLRGTVQPEIIIDRERETPTPFNNPPLIGPFALFEMTIETKSLTPPVETTAEEEGN